MTVLQIFQTRTKITTSAVYECDWPQSLVKVLDMAKANPSYVGAGGTGFAE